MAARKRHPVKAAGRLALYGSTRYTSKGSKKKHPKLKAFATTGATAYAGTMTGAIAGHTMSHGNPGAIKLGAQAGGFAGAAAGRRYAEHRGYIKRTKKRITVRYGKKVLKGGK